MAMLRTAVTAICFLQALGFALALECFTARGCDENRITKMSHKEHEYWTRSKEDANSCLMCICAMSKVYTKSCITLDEIDEKNVRKSGLKNRITEIARMSKSVKQPVQNDTLSVRDEEVQLTDKEAESIECPEEPTVILNEETGEFYFPPLKYVHYMYLVKVSHCCKNKITRHIDRKCTAKFDDRCRARIVNREDHTRLCQTPFPGKL